MVIATLAVQGLLQITIGVGFVLVAQSVRGRQASTPDVALAARAFLGWWYGLGGYIALLGVLHILASVGIVSYPLSIVIRMVTIPLLGVALWGMLTYVLYMYAGHHALRNLVALYALGLVVLFMAETFMNNDHVVVLGDWSAGLQPRSALFLNLVYAYFAIPLLMAIVAYAGLVRRVHGVEQRYRIVMVSASLGLWVLGGLYGETSGSGPLAFVLVSGLGAATSFVMLLAYRPPAAVRRWLAGRDAKRHFTPEAAREERATLPGWGPE